MNNYIHHVPGSLQIKNPMFKSNIDLLDQVRNKFEGAAGIDYITTNPLSGTIVINYDSNMIRPERLMELFNGRNNFNENRAPGLDYPHCRSISKNLKWAVISY